VEIQRAIVVVTTRSAIINKAGYAIYENKTMMVGNFNVFKDRLKDYNVAIGRENVYNYFELP
jgi:hypothetical protein